MRSLVSHIYSSVASLLFCPSAVEKTGEGLLSSAEGKATPEQMQCGRKLVKAKGESFRLAKDDSEAAKEAMRKELEELQEQLDKSKVH